MKDLEDHIATKLVKESSTISRDGDICRTAMRFHIKDYRRRGPFVVVMDQKQVGPKSFCVDSVNYGHNNTSIEEIAVAVGIDTEAGCFDREEFADALEWVLDGVFADAIALSLNYYVDI